MASFRSFAIAPAAGRSYRMGRQKLLLPFAGRPLIEHTLQAWTASAVERVVVVVRHDDSTLRSLCEGLPVDVACVESSPDMRASIEAGLDFLQSTWQPSGHNAWLTAPADLPTLSSGLVNTLVDAYDPKEPAVWAPESSGRRGHPVLLPWAAADSVRSLPSGAGLDQLLTEVEVQTVSVSGDDLPRDIDTPEDYRRLVRASPHAHRPRSRVDAG